VILSKDMLIIHVPKTGGMLVTRYLLRASPRIVYYSYLKKFGVDKQINDPLIEQYSRSAT
jgi:hypothetical protein